jgi:hypothetical protein
MFARYFIELPVSREEVERTLTDDPRRWLPGLATDANHRGDALLADVGFGERLRVKREVVLELGTAVRSSSKTAFPLRWRASDHPGLFPALDADLEVAPLGDLLTQLAMSARYVPPFGGVGRAIDRALLSRVAEATLKDFFRRRRHDHPLLDLEAPRGRLDEESSRLGRYHPLMAATKRPPLRVMLVDDHEVVRDGIRAMLESEEDVVVAGEAGAVQDAIDEAARTKPDIVVMDVRLADGSGIEATR